MESLFEGYVDFDVWHWLTWGRYVAGSGPLNLEMRAIVLSKQLFIRKEAHLSPVLGWPCKRVNSQTRGLQSKFLLRGVTLGTFPLFSLSLFLLFPLTNHWCCCKSGRLCLSTRAFPLESNGKALGMRLPRPHRKWPSLTTLWLLFPPEPKCPIYISTEYTCYTKLKGWLAAPDLDSCTGEARDNILSLTWRRFFPSAGQGKRGLWSFGAISVFLLLRSWIQRPILESFNRIFRLLVTV